MSRDVAYCMTRNLYRMIVPSMKSLLAHTKVDRIFVLAEDDDLGFWLPDNVTVINVSGQEYFKKTGPNYDTKYTYMSLMRLALPFILPDVNRILSLDLDTIITQDISELWDLPMEDKYIAGCIEHAMSQAKHCNYINFGVVMLNLEKLRDGMAKEMIRLLNYRTYLFPEQDCMNEQVPEENKLIISGAYNASIFNQEEMYVPKILHFAAFGAERFKEQDIVCEWGSKDWSEIIEE